MAEYKLKSVGDQRKRERWINNAFTITFIGMSAACIVAHRFGNSELLSTGAVLGVLGAAFAAISHSFDRMVQRLELLEKTIISAGGMGADRP